MKKLFISIPVFMFGAVMSLDDAWAVLEFLIFIGLFIVILLATYIGWPRSETKQRASLPTNRPNEIDYGDPLPERKPVSLFDPAPEYSAEEIKRTVTKCEELIYKAHNKQEKIYGRKETK